jgi:alpha-ketoglutaric semialdehyde dehydrogenase
VFTRDVRRVLEAVERFDLGVLHVNSETTGADVHVPFGGTKASGTSHREMGRAARDFFTEVKTVYVRA